MLHFERLPVLLEDKTLTYLEKLQMKKIQQNAHVYVSMAHHIVYDFHFKHDTIWISVLLICERSTIEVIEDITN